MKNISKLSQNRGLIRTIVLIVIALLILSYFGLNLRDIVNSPAGKDNFSFTQEVMIKIWSYIKGPVTYLWHIFIDLIWNPAIEALTKIRDGEPTSLETSAPRLMTSQLPPN